MKRISTTNAVPDLFGPGKAGFRDGNKAQGVPATEFNADWCNDIQEELANVIESAGITLDGDNRAQLLAAIKALSLVNNATETLAGIARIATAAETAAGKNDSTIITPAKLASALKNINGAYLTEIRAVAPNLPTPQGWVNISYSQPSFHPVAGMAADFVSGYYCGDAKNATADFGYRCNNLDGTGRNVSGQYIAIEPAANRFFRGMDDTGTRDPFMLHEDAFKAHNHGLKTSSGPQYSSDSENGYLPASTGGGQYYMWTNVSDRTNQNVIVAAGAGETAPKHIDKKFIMKVADGAVGDPALVDWQAWFDKWTEFSASAVKYADFTGSNQLLQGNGYQKLPGGLILQWGQSPESNAVPFNIAFPNSAFMVVVTAKDAGPQGTGYTTLGAVIDKATFRMSYGGSINGDVLNWFAIGN